MQLRNEGQRQRRILIQTPTRRDYHHASSSPKKTEIRICPIRTKEADFEVEDGKLCVLPGRFELAIGHSW
jgi:hypothetical protein